MDIITYVYTCVDYIREYIHKDINVNARVEWPGNRFTFYGLFFFLVPRLLSRCVDLHESARIVVCAHSHTQLHSLFDFAMAISPSTLRTLRIY